jgi:gamma-glutamylcyclotransferase (GGCT)/AIG2-like uncharacterized protein YtfP
MIHYFAYGSNLHPVRLSERVPSARLITPASLSNYKLCFHKKSKDGSGKCNIVTSDEKKEQVFGAIYQLDAKHKARLDQFESKGSGYIDKQIAINHEGQTYACFSYFAQESHIVETLQPYHWYKKLVLLGAGYLKFPKNYLESIKRVASINDPDDARNQLNNRLIESILNYR